MRARAGGVETGGGDGCESDGRMKKIEDWYRCQSQSLSPRTSGIKIKECKKNFPSDKTQSLVFPCLFPADSPRWGLVWEPNPLSSLWACKLTRCGSSTLVSVVLKNIPSALPGKPSRINCLFLLPLNTPAPGCSRP